MSNGEETAQSFRDTLAAIRQQIGEIIVGQDTVVDGVLVCLAANGHVLLEGMPGLGKTLLVKTLSQALNLSFSRIQFTPDMMPADVTGTNVLAGESGGRTFEFRRGPIFGNLVLADEINRATPKTQSALLEAMQEHTVTVGGSKHALPEPFLVMATQNPIEQEGTYPLPEAQLDRFFAKILVPFPTKDELAEVVNRTTGTLTREAKAVASEADILRIREVVRGVPIAKPVLDYALRLILATHPDSESPAPLVRKYVRYGSSPRGAQCLVTAAKIKALWAGRFNASVEDLREVAPMTLRHRLLLNFEADAEGVTSDMILSDAIRHVDAAERDPIRV